MFVNIIIEFKMKMDIKDSSSILHFFNIYLTFIKSSKYKINKRFFIYFFKNAKDISIKNRKFFFHNTLKIIRSKFEFFFYYSSLISIFLIFSYFFHPQFFLISLINSSFIFIIFSYNTVVHSFLIIL